MHRLQSLALTLEPTKLVEGHLKLTDSRSGKKYDVPIRTSREAYFINAKDLEKIQHLEAPLRLYDPGYMNTICGTSAISYIDGDKGLLEYRGYPIEQLAEKSSFLEVTFLLIFGELPTRPQLDEFAGKVLTHTILHNDIEGMMKCFRYDAHPMGMLISTIAAFSTLKPEANPALAGNEVYRDTALRNKQIYRLLGLTPTMAANAYRHRIGRPYNLPSEKLGYVENFLYMLDCLNDKEYSPHPKLVRALEVLFILHAEHEMNCSTAFTRHMASSGVDIYTTMASAAAALYGVKHGGANEAVIRMLTEIGEKGNIPKFIAEVKAKKRVLSGFGHRVYKNYDPRAKIVKRVAFEVFELTGKEPLVEIAIELEKIALSDPYFIERKLYPNVDFYSGVIYRAMGFPTDMFPVLFTIPRVAGWIAHWVEYQSDKENNIVRPRQNYQGPETRHWVPAADRKDAGWDFSALRTDTNRRRNVQ